MLLILVFAITDHTDAQIGILGLAVSSLAYSIVGAIVCERRQSVNGKKTFGTLILFSTVWILVQLLWIDALDKSGTIFTIDAAGAASVLTIYYVTIRIWVFKETPRPSESHMRPGARPEWIESPKERMTSIGILCMTVLPILIGPAFYALGAGWSTTMLFPTLSLSIFSIYMMLWFTTAWVQKFMREKL